MPPLLPENVHWRLKQIHGGKIFDVNTTDNYMIGRNQNAQISLNSNKTSRLHASFVVNVEGHLLVQDLKSVNGTFVNGTQIAVYVLHRLFPGDIVGFGLADIELSENDRDRQTIFFVMYEEPHLQAIPPINANLADSTTDSGENVGINSSRGNRFSIRNSSKEIGKSYFSELPSTSNIKHESIDIIEIASSSGSDEEKPDLNCFEEDPVLKITDVRSIPEGSLERNNWVQKPTSSVKSTKTVKYLNPSLNISPYDKEKNKSDLQEASKKTEKEVTDEKVMAIKVLRKQKNYGVHSPETSNQEVTSISTEFGNKQITLKDKVSKDIVTSYLETNFNKDTSKKPARRKSLATINTKEPLRLKSFSAERKYFYKSAEADHSTETALKNKELASLPLCQNVVVPDSKEEITEHTRQSKHTLRRKSIASCQPHDVNPQTQQHPITSLEIEKPTSTHLRRNSVAVVNTENDNDTKKQSLRCKSISVEPSYINNEVVSNQQKNKLVQEVCNRESAEPTVTSANKDKSKNPAVVYSRRTSLNTLGTERSSKCLSKRKSLAEGPPDKHKDSDTKTDKKVGKRLCEKNSVCVSSSNDAKKDEINRKSGVDNSSKRTLMDISDDELLIQLDQAIGGTDFLSPPTVVTNKEQTVEKSKSTLEGNNKCLKKKVEPEESELKTKSRHKHKKVKVDDCDPEFIFHHLKAYNEGESKEISPDKNDPFYSAEKNKSTLGAKYLSPSCHNDSNGDHKNQNKHVKKLGSKDLKPGTSSDQGCSVNSANSKNINTAQEKPSIKGEKFTNFKEPSLRNISVLETTFTTDKDNSVIIDITDGDDDYDDVDFSCSQIFHMSQIVKTEMQDDTFQKIKNELAEMEFCQEETIINPVPIDVEDNDMSGFENTQDICAYLEDGVAENESNANFISNEENEEISRILGDFDKDPSNKDCTLNAEDINITLDESSILSKTNENDSVTLKDKKLHNKIDSSSSSGKSKYAKPPVIEPHSVVKQKKDVSKTSPLKQDIDFNKEEKKSHKRKNSLETPAKKKKLKGSPKSVAEPPRCDSKSIQMEFKKRNSYSKMDQDKLQKANIREERRKKLKEISERSFSPKIMESKSNKAKTVKVLPESKTSRGSYLCEEVKKNIDGAMKAKINRNSGGVKELVINVTSVEASHQNTRRARRDGSFNLPCNCYELDTSGHQIECQAHKMNLSDRDTGGNKSFDINANHPSSKIPRRSKTPTNDFPNYNLKPIDLPESTSKYNLRRTKSSGDIKADLAKSNGQPRPAQSHYNLRHSTALEGNINQVIQEPLQNYMKGGLRRNNTVNYVVPPYPSNAALRPVHMHQRPQYVQPIQINQRNTAQGLPYHSSSRATNDLSRKLMWSNGGPSNHRRAPAKRLPGVEEVVQKMVNWLPNWLSEQVNIDSSAPINSPPARKIPLNFRNFDQYYNTFSKLVLLENWQYLYKGFREGAEKPRKVKIEHVRVSNDLLTIDCISYITQQELRQGLFYKPEDLILIECVMNDKSNSYMSLNFGFILRSKKSTISNEDVISIRSEMRHVGSYCVGEPHTKLEFTIVTRYQPDKEINMKKFPIVKLLANVRAHLMMIRAIKMLVDSPICSKILHPKMNEYKFPVTQSDIIQPHSLNTQQRSIVLEAASLCTGTQPGIYCIKGPPGTGKSTVIVHLVFQILFSHYVTKRTKEPPMILLAAPSNTAVDNLLAKLTAFKRSLPTEWDKYKSQIKCVRIGPESSISKELIGYSLPKLAEKHIPIKHMDTPEFRAAKERNQNLLEFSRSFFGDGYGYEIKACEDLIIAKSNIICTTLNSCINGKLTEAVNRGLIKFSCCIIDEATQCHEVEALLPTILGIDKFVLVGDPKQLNATIMNRDAVKLGFGESLFSRIANNFTNDPRTPIKMLTDQYRMHSEICAFPNKKFYEGKLKSLPKHHNKLPEQINPYLVFNCTKINDSSDYTNQDEVHLIKKLLSTIFGMIKKNHKYTVGIITPYNAQKDLISSNIQDLGVKNSNCKITVNTVDSFQGSENDIIIISCVRDSTNSFLQNENRLNVALTRAKQALYVIGNYTLFKECRPLYDLREDAKKRKLLLDIKQDPKLIENFSKYLLKHNNKE